MFDGTAFRLRRVPNPLILLGLGLFTQMCSGNADNQASTSGDIAGKVGGPCSTVADCSLPPSQCRDANTVVYYDMRPGPRPPAAASDREAREARKIPAHSAWKPYL
jgi:hypothetical protein